MSSTITPRLPLSLSARPTRSTSGSGSATLSDAGWAVLVALRPAVLSFLRHRCRDEHQAEDLAHDTIIRAARHRTCLSLVARPRAWAIQIAANVQRDHARRESRQRLSPPDHPVLVGLLGSEPIPGDLEPAVLYEIEGHTLDGEDLIGEVRALWGELPSRDRAVLSSYYSDEGSTRAAAEACGISHGLVKVRLFRARRRLELAVRARLARTR